MSFWRNWGLAVAAFSIAASGAWAQDSSEIAELKAQFEREMRLLTEAFNEKLAALE